MAKKLSQEEVINKINDVHGSLYDHSKLTYINKRTKFELICKKHGAFFTTLDQIIRSQGCPICGKSDAAKKRRVSFESFFNKANKVHNSKYEYDKDSYIKISEKIKIKCPIHGWFEQMADAHSNHSYGCPKCGRLVQISKRKLSNEEFVTMVSKIHSNKFDYSKVNYINNKTKVEVICNQHGSFFPTPDNHLLGSGCPNCGIEKVHAEQIKDLDSFIKDSINLHGKKYDYSNVNYLGGKKMVTIICSKHGPFEQTPNNHQQGNGCPNCKTSKGEEMVIRILSSLDIIFKQQFTFENLIDKRKLKCDFYLPDYNAVIEFNGIQHYEPINRFGNVYGFEETQRRDKIKRDYLLLNSISLLEIHYQDMDIEKTIKSFLGIIPNSADLQSVPTK